MGLDISFDRNKALTAGLQTKIVRNGSDSELKIALGWYGEDEDYIQWLQESSECVIIPFTEAFVTNDGVGDRVVVRANKWGDNYLPLTLWLKHHNIELDEF